jgi:ATP/maltotriose-dependent transcriptional regulator MalT
VSTAVSDPLGQVRAAIAAHDWAAALDAAQAAASATADDPRADADRADLEAEAAWWLGRLDTCIAARERAYQGYDELGARREAGQCAVWLWEHHMISARPAIAGAWLRRARNALDGDTECVAYGSLLLREAEVAHGQGDLAGAAARAAEVIDLARRLRSADLEAEALQTRGRIRIDEGDVARGMGDLDEAMLFAVEGRLRPFSTGKVYCSLISACEEVGDVDRAAEWTEATLRWAQQHPFAIFPGICRVHRAMVLKRKGDLAEAEREAARACEELSRSHVGNSAAAHAEVGDIRRRLGDLDAAESAFARAHELNGRTCGGLALVRLAQGRTDDAVATIAGCLHDTGHRLARAALLPIQVHVAVAAGDLDTARAALEELAAIVEDYRSPLLEATLLSTRGRLELAEGAPSATVTLRDAVAAWDAMAVPYEVATARTLLGEALRGAGDEAAATEAFRAASEVFDLIGARLDAEQLSGAEAKPALPAGLTSREVEILQLVADGMTNNEIASALYLSAKTVSRHLSNIFTKIDVSSRAGATAFAFEHRLVDPKRPT